MSDWRKGHNCSNVTSTQASKEQNFKDGIMFNSSNKASIIIIVAACPAALYAEISIICPHDMLTSLYLKPIFVLLSFIYKMSH